MMYDFQKIEKKWQKSWKDNNTYRVNEEESTKKFYVLDMFPYPSGVEKFSLINHMVITLMIKK